MRTLVVEGLMRLNGDLYRICTLFGDETLPTEMMKINLDLEERMKMAGEPKTEIFYATVSRYDPVVDKGEMLTLERAH